MIKIEYGHNKPGRKKRESKYPFSKMKVGGSFFVATYPQNILTSFKAWCSSNKKAWLAQSWTEMDGKVKGARIKRVK